MLMVAHLNSKALCMICEFRPWSEVVSHRCVPGSMQVLCYQPREGPCVCLVPGRAQVQDTEREENSGVVCLLILFVKHQAVY